MEILALVGPSGTGKSYKSLNIAYENDVEYLIDDGILISKNRIIAGISAKNSATKMEAVRRAIFDDESHRIEVRDMILSQKPKKLMVIGTSERMIRKIVKRLELDGEIRWINISDVATKEEIEEARNMRMNQGIHTVPLPTFEVKSHFSGIFKNPIKFLLKKGTQTKVEEKTLIRPTFSYLGKYYISEGVIKDIIAHEATQIEGIFKISGVEVIKKSQGIGIVVSVRLNNQEVLKVAKNLQHKVIEGLEDMTHINILYADIKVERLDIN